MSATAAAEALGQMIGGYWVSQAIYVAAELGIEDVRSGLLPAAATRTRSTSSLLRSAIDAASGIRRGGGRLLAQGAVFLAPLQNRDTLTRIEQFTAVESQLDQS